MQQREDHHERAGSGPFKEASMVHGAGEILFVRHERNHRQLRQLGESRKLFRRAYRMIERFREGAGANSAGKSQNKAQKHNGGPVRLIRLLRQAGWIDERKPLAFSLNL